MSYIVHSGYGYSKRVCDDAASWFLNHFISNSKVFVDIQHRGMKREGAYGFCDYIHKIRISNRYYSLFHIELDTYMQKDLYVKTLFHEMTHMRQWVEGNLQVRRGKLHYHKEPVEFYDYENQPHEIEAREQEEILYVEYMKEKV